MTVVIWFVQLITYPQFTAIGAAEFPQYHSDYCYRIGYLVVPLMFLELLTGGAAVCMYWQSRWRRYLIVSLGLTLSTWVITFLVQAPQHQQLLEGGKLPAVIKALVQWNWLRTLAWSLNCLLLGWLLNKALKVESASGVN